MGRNSEAARCTEASASRKGLQRGRVQRDDMLESKPGPGDADSGNCERSTVHRRSGINVNKDRGGRDVPEKEASLRGRSVGDLTQSESNVRWAWLVRIGSWWQNVGVPVLLLAGGTAASVLFTVSNIRADQNYMQEIFSTMSEAVAKGAFDALTAGIRETSMATAVERIERLLGPYLSMEDFDKLAEGFIALNGECCRRAPLTLFTRVRVFSR